MTARKYAVAVIAMLVFGSGCAAQTESPTPTQEEIGSTSDPIKTADSRWTVALQSRATVNPEGTVTVDLSTGNLFGVGPNDPHNNPGGNFTHVWVWAFTEGKWVNLGSVALSPEAVGPGGGCIHFRVAGLNVGDTIQLASTVKMPDSKQTWIGAVDTTVHAAPYVQLPSMIGEPIP